MDGISNHSFHDSLNTDLVIVLHDSRKWLKPLIVGFGLVGNMISIYVCLSSKLRRAPSTLYLVMLAAYDSVYLLTEVLMELVLWLQLTATFAWRLPLYVMNVAGCLSAWVVAAFTLERYIVVCYPLHGASICTPGRSRRTLLALAPLPMLFNLPHLFIADPLRAERLIIALVLTDGVLAGLLPAALVIGLNALIVRTILKESAASGRSLRKTAGGAAVDSKEQQPTGAVTTNNEAESNSKATAPKPAAGGASDPAEVTRMLIIISTVFALLNLPGHYFRMKVVAMEWAADDDDDVRRRWWSPTDEALQTAAETLYMINFAIDFILYNFSSRKFRRIAVDLLRVGSQRLLGGTAAATGVNADARRQRVERPSAFMSSVKTAATSVAAQPAVEGEAVGGSPHSSEIPLVESLQKQGVDDDRQEMEECL